MRLGRRLALLAAVTTLLGGPVAATVAGASAASAATPASTAASASAATSNGWVRCANLSPGTPEDVYLYPFGDPGHPVVLMNAQYGEVYDYMAVSAGEYTVAMRPVGAPASSAPSVSTSFMVSAGANYTVASLGSPADRQLKVLQDQMAASKGDVLVRVIQASVKQPRVTVSIGSTVLARQLSFGSATSYQAVPAGSPTVTFSAPGGHAAMAVTLAAGSVHSIVVLDGASGLQVDNLTDAAASQDTPQGGAATGLGGTAPGNPEVAPWLAMLVGGLLLAATGGLGLRKSRRMVTSG